MSPAIAVAAFKLFEPVVVYNAGWRDLPDTTFRIGSSSKAVTTRQAMNHTAGVRDYGICLCFPIWEYYNRSYYETQRETLGIVEGSDLLFVPGERFFYTSYGYNITGAVIESVTGKGFNDYLKDSVFVPLGLDGIRVDSGTPRATDAVFYELANGRFKPVFQVDNSNKLPSGGILATPSDLVRLGQQMIAPTLFSSDTRDQLVRRQFLADGEPNPQGYALGWRTGETQLLRGTITTPVYHHHGVAYGAVSHFSVYPQIGMVVSVMMNKNQGDFDGVPAQLVDLFVTGLQSD